MRKYFGAWLCLVLGAVLITTGLTTGASGNVGTIVVPPACGIPDVGQVSPCPTATVTVNETTSQAQGSVRAAVPTPPAGGWTIHVTSACASTVDGSKPMDETFTVPDGASGTSASLFAYPDTRHATKCDYTLTEDPVAGFTAAWDPSNTFTLTVDPDGIAENASVDLTNSAAVTITTSTVPVSSTAPRTSTVPASTSAAPSSRPVTRTSARASASPSASASAVLAATGPRSRIDTTVILGIGLCALGLLLLVAGRVERRRARHRP